MKETFLCRLLSASLGRSGKEPACQCRRYRRLGFPPWDGKDLCRREWQPRLVFLPGKFHAQRNLAGYGPGDCKESDITEHSTDYFYTQPAMLGKPIFSLPDFLL